MVYTVVGMVYTCELLNPAVPVLGNSREFPGVKTFVWLSNIGNYFFVIAACTAGKGGQFSLHSWVKYCLGIQRRIQQNVCPPSPPRKIPAIYGRYLILKAKVHVYW